VDPAARISRDEEATADESREVANEIVVLCAIALETVDTTCENQDSFPMEMAIDDVPAVANVG